MQSRLKCELKSGTTNHYILSGLIDETAQFPAIPPTLKEAVHFDLDQVKYISSFGVKMWVEYFSKTSTPFVFHRVHPGVLKNFNSVQGFMPKKSQIASLYAPFCEPKTFEATAILLENNTHYGKYKNLSLPSVKGKDGSPMEPDFVANSFFRFLPNQAD
ncbi:MAG: hypothetical protein K2Q26_11415 [Bdellovibrionales bacterium]|nr:hypothetical protein [Bdellovibrionales bacterium]